MLPSQQPLSFRMYSFRRLLELYDYRFTFLPASDATNDAWNRSRALVERIANERASCPPTSGMRGRRNWDLRSRAGRRLRLSQLRAGGDIGARAPAAPQQQPLKARTFFANPSL